MSSLLCSGHFTPSPHLPPAIPLMSQHLLLVAWRSNFFLILREFSEVEADKVWGREMNREASGSERGWNNRFKSGNCSPVPGARLVVRVWPQGLGSQNMGM